MVRMLPFSQAVPEEVTCFATADFMKSGVEAAKIRPTHLNVTRAMHLFSKG
jgi:hypothetical protein